MNERQMQSILEMLAGHDRMLRCAFCGHAYPDGTPAFKHQSLTDHIGVCAEHPIGKELRAAADSLNRLKTECLALREECDAAREMHAASVDMKRRDQTACFRRWHDSLKPSNEARKMTDENGILLL